MKCYGKDCLSHKDTKSSKHIRSGRGTLRGSGAASAMTTQGSPKPSLYSVPSSHKNTAIPAYCLSSTGFSDSGKDLGNEPDAVSFWIGRPVSAAGLCAVGLPEIITLCFASELARSFYHPEASLILILS